MICRSGWWYQADSRISLKHIFKIYKTCKLDVTKWSVILSVPHWANAGFDFWQWHQAVAPVSTLAYQCTPAGLFCVPRLTGCHLLDKLSACIIQSKIRGIKRNFSLFEMRLTGDIHSKPMMTWHATRCVDLWLRAILHYLIPHNMKESYFFMYTFEQYSWNHGLLLRNRWRIAPLWVNEPHYTYSKLLS